MPGVYKYIPVLRTNAYNGNGRHLNAGQRPGQAQKLADRKNHAPPACSARCCIVPSSCDAQESSQVCSVEDRAHETIVMAAGVVHGHGQADKLTRAERINSLEGVI